MSPEDGAPNDARQTLLRALDHLDTITTEHGHAKKVYLVVAYAHQVQGSTIRGWAATDDPTFATAGLLREVADAIDDGGFTITADEDEDQTE